MTLVSPSSERVAQAQTRPDGVVHGPATRGTPGSLELEPPGVGKATVGPATVLAVVVSHNGSQWLPRALAALAEQTRRPDLVVGVDTGSDDGSADLLRAALGADHVVTADRSTGFGAAVRLGLQHAGAAAPGQVEQAQRPDWVWLLHDDAAAAPTALAHLLDAAALSSAVGIVGPKLVDWDDATLLVEAGITVSRSGRRSTGVQHGERDQGQHDHRTDVLAVGTAGMLVSRDLWDRLGGLDPALPLLRDDVDLCWRAHLAGRRVVLAARAVVADAQAASRGLRPVDAVRGALPSHDRRSALHVALARCSWPALPLTFAWLVVGGLLRSLGLLAVGLLGLGLVGRTAARRGRHELLATLAVALSPWTWLGSRWRARGSRVVSRRTVAPLLRPRRAVARDAVDLCAALATRDRASRRAGAAAGDRAAGPTRLAGWPLATALAVVAGATALAQRRTPVRGELIAAQGRPGDLWHAAVGTWSGAGLGSGQAPSPAAVVRAAAAALLWPVAGDQAAGRVADLALLAAPVLAAASAYLAAGLLARSRWLRAWAAVAWATMPLLTGVVDEGRLGPAAAYVLLPLVAQLVARALGGSVPATCAAALGVVLVGSAVPALLVPSAMVAVGGLLLCRGVGRACSGLLLLLAAGLLGPWLRTIVGDPRHLVAGPGALMSGPARTPVEALADLTSVAGWPTWAAGLMAAPLVLAGLTGLLRSGPRARAVLGVWAVGLLGLAGALAAPLVTVTRSTEGPLRPWPGTALLLVLLAALAGALVAADGLRGRLARHGFGWRQLLVAPLAAAAVLAPVAAGATWAWSGRSSPAGTSAPPARPPLPAVALDAAHGPAALRTLVISGDDRAIAYRLVGAEPGSWSRDLPMDHATAPVTAAVQALAAPVAGDSDATVPSLRRLAVGFVVVDRSAPGHVLARLDSSAGLARLGSTGDRSIWRVLRPAGRVVVADRGADEGAVVPSGAHAAVDADVAAGPAGRRLLLAEPVSSGWRATLDGRELPSVADPAAPWRQAFTLPAGGGRLVVEHTDPVRTWWLAGQAVLAAAVAIVALGRRRRPV